jgi:phosphoribosylformimino-5-aminoimidazole carboxamide ribotide isomerase
LKVIPVIDVLNGIVVHAVKGRRKEYQPIKSILCDSVDPVKVAKTFKALGFSEIYLADLDAITGKQANFEVYKRIQSETGLNLMVDAGITDIEAAKKLLENGVSKVVIGTETLQNKSFVQEAVSLLGKDRVIVSLDLMGDKIMVKLGFDGCKDALCLLRQFRQMGVLEFIVLDLMRVGSGEGVNMDFLKKALADLQEGVYVGGGVRSIEDLVELRNLGLSRALVASALHNGKITIASLKQQGFL